MRLMAMLAGVVAIAAIATGCGSGGSDPLTKAEFIEQADRICKEGSNQIRKEYEAFAKQHNTAKTGVSQEQGTEIGLQILLPNVQSQTEELRELEPPEGDEAQVAAMLDALEAGVEEGNQNPKSLLSSNYPLSKGNQLAQKYGFKVCGQA